MSHKKIQCINCKEEISFGAKLCHVCKSYQCQWKNLVNYIASITALIALSGSAIFWLATSISSTFFYQNDVQVIEGNTLGSAIIVNRGNNEVFLSRLMLWMPERVGKTWVAPELPIYEKLLPHQFLTKEFPESKIKEAAYFVRGLNADDFKKLLDKAISGDPCWKPTFYVDTDTLLRDEKVMAGPTLNTFKVSGYLEYWGIHNSNLSRVELNGTGLLRHIVYDQCK